MEYAEFGTLDAFQKDVNVAPHLARRLLVDIGLGINALHQCNIIHGDVKSENVLICRHLKRKYIARLCDFGLAVINPSSTDKHSLPGGTWLWCSPESRERLSVEELQMTDVYSFGLTAWRVLANHPNPFSLLSTTATGGHAASSQEDFVRRVKENEDFPEFVMQTIVNSTGNTTFNSFVACVIHSTLTKNPVNRSLAKAISALAIGCEMTHK
jgi:serine/threonine protein kinase